MPTTRTIRQAAVVGLCGMAMLGCANMRLKPTPERMPWIAGAVADVETSQAAFARGATEGNPLIISDRPGRAELYAYKAASWMLSSGIEAWLRGMQRNKKLPKWFRWLFWSVGAVTQGVVALHNTKVAR